MIEVTLVLILVFIGGLANGLMDMLQFRFEKLPEYIKNNSEFWNPKISRKNKWLDGDKTKGEKFRFSSTFLVFLTDGWHLAKEIMISSFALACSIGAVSIFGLNFTALYVVLIFLVIRAVFCVGFTLIFKK